MFVIRACRPLNIVIGIVALGDVATKHGDGAGDALRSISEPAA